MQTKRQRQALAMSDGGRQPITAHRLPFNSARTVFQLIWGRAGHVCLLSFQKCLLGCYGFVMAVDSIFKATTTAVMASTWMKMTSYGTTSVTLDSIAL